LLARDDVVGQVGVDRCPDLALAGLDLGHEAQQRAPVVRLWETLALQQVTAFQLGIRVEEPVSRHELHTWGARPSREELLEEASRSGLADRDGPGNPDDERGLLGPLAEEVGRDAVQPRS